MPFDKRYFLWCTAREFAKAGVLPTKTAVAQAIALFKELDSNPDANPVEKELEQEAPVRRPVGRPSGPSDGTRRAALYPDAHRFVIRKLVEGKWLYFGDVGGSSASSVWQPNLGRAEEYSSWPGALRVMRKIDRENVLDHTNIRAVEPNSPAPPAPSSDPDLSDLQIP